MTLLQFRVQKFRSVEDSGWITCDQVTTLVGMNEAGKSNLLIALWKLKPAQGGELNLLSDMPRRLYSTARNAPEAITFIEADFALSASQARTIVHKGLLCNTEGVQIRLSRTFDGVTHLKFLDAEPTPSLTTRTLHPMLTETLESVQIASAPAQEQVKASTEAVLLNLLEQHSSADASITLDRLKDWSSRLNWASLPEGTFKAALLKIWREVQRLWVYFEKPQDIPGMREVVLEAIPSFVYYSNYGNLDSEIYLPHAIENMSRRDLTGSAEAKARTLRVLFEFVGLKPEEIRDMGQEPGQGQHRPSDQDVAAIAARKTERQALLHSAQSKLSREFREWWKQGEYSFDFRVDGNFFRIYVSDTLRPENIELENRSTGLQWFLSFYLVFLVESAGSHQGTTLLLDEAGHSLHPLAQRDLAAFFANLSQTHQVIHTTQSPFLVDTNHVDRVKVVYADPQGFTVASDDLRATEALGNQGRSVYAVHAALGLSISDTLLQGCQPVLVEGVSDQIYFNALKNFLIHHKQIAPAQELLFVPAGGSRGIKPLTSLFTAREGELPVVVMDSDQDGRALLANLKAELYQGAQKRLLPVGDFLSVPDAEVEDLIPLEVLSPLLDRIFRDADELFMDQHNSAQPVVDQITAFAGRHGIALERHWKVTLASRFKTRLLARNPPAISKETVAVWKKLFIRMLSA